MRRTARQWPLWFGLLSPLLVSGLSAGEWPTTDWEILCYVPGSCQEWYGLDSACPEDQSDLQGYLGSLDRHEEFEWKGREECDQSKPGSMAAEAAALLRKASIWLEEQGFEPPLLQPSESTAGKLRYKAFLTPPFSTVGILGAVLDARPGYIYVSQDPGENYLFLVGLTAKDAAHELFHAVQHNHPAWKHRPDSIPDWIREGTAEAVGMSFAGQDVRAMRKYDEVLHWDAREPEAYEDQYFWRFVSNSFSGGLYEFLLPIFNQNIEGDGLAAVDAGLKAAGHEGLYAVYPEFTARKLGSEEFFEGLPEVEPRVTAEDPVDEPNPVRVTIDQVATEPIRVIPHVPAGELAILTLEPKEDKDWLHLAVEAFGYSDMAPRNRFETEVEGGMSIEYLARLSNVAQEAPSTTEQSAELKVRLELIGACEFRAQVSGDVSGSHHGGVAHYSTSGETTIYGAFTDTEMIKEMGEFFGANEMAEEWAREIESMPTETLGISLMEMDPDGDEAEGLAALVGGFTLEASVLDGPPLTEATTGEVPLAMLSVVPGPIAESTFDKVQFKWVEGAKGNARLEILKVEEGVLTGRITGHLYAPGYYFPDQGSRAPEIEVSVWFKALEGRFSCFDGFSSYF